VRASVFARVEPERDRDIWAPAAHRASVEGVARAGVVSDRGAISGERGVLRRLPETRATAAHLQCDDPMKERPRTSWPAVEAADAASTRTLRSDTFEKQHLVLVVDDRAENRELCRECLSFAGFHVLEASNGAEAVKLAGERLPDVIVMDVAMPVMDGYEASRLLKSDPRTKGIPVILLTASPRDTAANEDHVDAVLLKPCLPDDLELEVRKWVEVRRRPPRATPE
jgi:two-component system cell cycle response regulator DivK